MNSQLTLNLNGTVVSITPQDGQRTILEIVTNDGISSLKSLHTEDMNIENKQQNELSSLGKDEFENSSDNVNQTDLIDPIEELKMYDEEKPHIKPLNLDHLDNDDDNDDIVEKMTSDLKQPSAMNYGRHMELPDDDENLNFKPGPIVELENDKPYEKVELTDENDDGLEEYDSDNVSSISRILEHEKQLSEKAENINDIKDDSSNNENTEIENENVDYDNNDEDSENDLTVNSNEMSQESQVNDDSAFLERDRKKEKTTSLSFTPDEGDYGEDETEF